MSHTVRKSGVLDFSVNKIGNSIVHLVFENTDKMNDSLMRIQEYYESPHFAGKVFTLGEFKKWYAEQYGAFTYYQDTDGMNFPSTCLEPFFQGLFDPLTESEQATIDALRPRANGSPFYVIATEAGAYDTIEHECCHGLYWLYEGYREAVHSIINSNRQKIKSVDKFLKDQGYSRKVWEDELQAFICANYSYLQDEKLIEVPRKVHSEIRKVYDKYMNVIQAKKTRSS